MKPGEMYEGFLDTKTGKLANIVHSLYYNLIGLNR